MRADVGGALAQAGGLFDFAEAIEFALEASERVDGAEVGVAVSFEEVGTVAQSAGKFLVVGAKAMTAGTALFLLNLFVMLYGMFFFFRDGVSILERIFYYIPLSHEDEERMLGRLRSVTRATIKGTLVIGAIQGTLAGLGFWIAGIEGAAFWGTVMVVLSVVPGIGAALVWVPGVIFLYLTGHATAATLLGLWCA